MAADSLVEQVGIPGLGKRGGVGASGLTASIPWVIESPRQRRRRGFAGSGSAAVASTRTAWRSHAGREGGKRRRTSRGRRGAPSAAIGTGDRDRAVGQAGLAERVVRHAVDREGEGEGPARSGTQCQGELKPRGVGPQRELHPGHAAAADAEGGAQAVETGELAGGGAVEFEPLGAAVLDAEDSLEEGVAVVAL